MIAVGVDGELHPPFAINFTLSEPGFVTLVVEGAHGERVRNLISETPFPAGKNTVWWDGLDDLGRNPEAADRGVYDVPGKPVGPGLYRVRGLVRPQLKARWLMAPYFGRANPPWNNGDRSSEWLANHSPPSAVVFVPAGEAPERQGHPASAGGQVIVGSDVTEGGSGVAWLDLDGNKLHGQMWIGGIWTGASQLTRDAGNDRVPGVYAYTASAWENELRLFELRHKVDEAPDDGRLGAGDDKPVLLPTWKFPGTPDGTGETPPPKTAISGLAAHNGLIAVSVPTLNQLLFVDGKGRRALGTIPMNDPRGLAFDATGRLLVLSGAKLLRYSLIDWESYVQAGPYEGELLTSDGWKANADHNDGEALRAIDGKTFSRWSTKEPQKAGMTFTLDLRTVRKFTRVVLDSSGSRDEPREYDLYISNDGQNWGAPVAKGEGHAGQTTIDLPRAAARFLKIVQNGSTDDHWWSINELTLYDKAPDHKVTPPQPPPQPEILVTNLDNPQNLALDHDGNIYVSEHGQSHQVKVFNPVIGQQGAAPLLRAIGHPGALRPGRYDPQRMTDPDGLAIDSNDHLWVAENNFQPKRLSVWETKTGKLWKAFYGGPEYGGGGQLDSRNPNVFYYGGMTLALDFPRRATKPSTIFYNREADPLQTTYEWGGAPQQPIHRGRRTYLTDCYNLHPTNGLPLATLWLMQRNGVARAVAALGRANDWKLLKTDMFRARWPRGVDPDGANWWYGDGAARNGTLFAWWDANGDGKVQPAEVQMQKAATGGVTVMPDLSFVVARVGAKPDGGSTMRYAPTRLTRQGVPVYDLGRGQLLATGTQMPPSSGGDQAWVGRDGWTFLSTAPAPFSPYGIAGVKNGVPRWSYPNPWPGLHASHHAPEPDRPGEIIGLTKLLGPSVTPKGEAGELLALNGNKGTVYLVTTDGLFVATLFKDSRLAAWNASKAIVGQDMLPYSLGEETFFPTITQTLDGSIYLQGNTSLMRLEGLDKIQRLPTSTVRVTKAGLEEAQRYRSRREATPSVGGMAAQTLVIPTDAAALQVDGRLNDWKKVEFAQIDSRTKAALAVSGDRLFAAFKTDDPNLLRNRPETLQNTFKTGGALDLMLEAIPGGVRLLVTRSDDKTIAMLYRPRVPGTTTEPVKFASNIGAPKTVEMDRVDDVSDQVQLANDSGLYEFSVPLSLLGLESLAGKQIKGDLGILRGNGFQTLQRVYWHNKSAGLVSDLASEAELTPQSWGTFEFKAGR